MLDALLADVLHTTAAHRKKLEEMGIRTVQNLLEYFPRALEPSEVRTGVGQLILGEKNTLQGTLHAVRKERTPRGKTLVKAALHLSDGAAIDVVWFQVPYILKNIPDGKEVFLVGKLQRQYGRVQCMNPEVHLEGGIHVGTLRCIYPESAPITSKWLREKIRPLLSATKEYEEMLPDDMRNKENLMEKARAMAQMHAPESEELWYEARRRLGLEEVFLIQLRTLRAKKLRQLTEENPHVIPMNVEQVKQDLQTLPFQMTLGQKQALHEILTDMEKPRLMHRLLQGDVGSGKTIVAFLAMKAVARTGAQTVLLAPTEILAKQHFTNALKFFGAQFRVELLTGSVPAKQKEKIKTELRTGGIHILIGTHAVLTEDTVFQNLGLAIIDEQHRFGVRQRATLAENNCHVLAMTATPIPRTLALTVYGDQDLSSIDELPPGRIPIVTRVIADEPTATLCRRFIDDQITKEKQIFWICPLIDESDAVEAKNVHALFEEVSQVYFPRRRVQFLHGKLKPKEKDSIMADFRAHEFDILVSTSVIEVGVDIPNATVMVIENAERFGLAQLHQFRGRIGRNDRQCYCFLMVSKPDDKNNARLRTMERSNSGLHLAEMDLKLRGSGELYGLRQSGLPDFKCADPMDLGLMKKARDWAVQVLTQDFELRAHPALRRTLEAQEVLRG